MRLQRRAWRRVLAVLVLAAGLAPVIWVRAPVPDASSTKVAVTAIPFAERTLKGLTLTGLWQLQGQGDGFGGYSALLLDRHALWLFSDRGFLLTVPRNRAGLAAMTRQLALFGPPRSELFDIESATMDRATGQFWIGYESRHTIYRYGPGSEPQAFVRPEYTRKWRANGGIEALVRLSDGRFLAFREGEGEFFLHSGDPAAGGEALRGVVAWPGDYVPTDAAQLPDGRLVVVLRRLALHLPVFDCRLVLLDLADLPQVIEGAAWQPQPLVQLERLVPRDNWEAVAVEPAADGTVDLWLASDDNRSAFQRSLLARLSFTPPPRPEPGQ